MNPRKVEQILGVSREEADPSASSSADNGLSLFKSIPFNKMEGKIATESKSLKLEIIFLRLFQDCRHAVSTGPVVAYGYLI